MLTKTSARVFFFGGTLLFTLVFIGLTVHAHITLAERTNDAAIDDSVRRGLRVWGEYNCENCHTLLGEGAYYAPDLTQIVDQRGAGYLAAFLRDPSQFYSEEGDGRLMPTLGLDDEQITDVIAFLDWVGNIDTNGWPPRPILVSGSATATYPAVPGEPQASSPAERGRALFNGIGACASCHAVTSDIRLIGPGLGGVATRASERIADAAYRGNAKTAEEYLRESLLEPDAFLVPDGNFATPAGQSFMPKQLDERLSDEQIDDLVAYLLTLE